MAMRDARRPRRGWSRPVLAALAGLVVAACAAQEPASAPGTVRIGDIRWYVDYDAALEVAREQDKALWVHFGENPG